MKSSAKWIAFGCLLLSGAGCVAQTAPQYTVQMFDKVDYPYLMNFSSLNNKGEVIGTVYPSAFVYRNGAFQYLDLPSSGITNRTSLNAINDASQIVGNDSLGRPFIYKNAEQLLDFGPKARMPITVLDINSSGQILARSGYGVNVHTFVYQDGTATDLGPGYPNNINSRGEITGAFGSYLGDAFLYTHGLTLNLGALAGPNTISSAGSIDSSGRVIVLVQKQDRNYNYLYVAGKLQLLPGVGGGMNDCGEIIQGEDLYSHGQTYHLKDLIPPGSKLKSQPIGASAINNAGEIIGTAGRDYGRFQFILTPVVPEKCGSDVTIDNNPDSATIRPGGEIDYTILVKNLDSPTTQLAVKDVLGLRTIFQSCSVSGTAGTCERTADKGVISINLPSLAKGGTATIHIVAKGYSTAGDDQLIQNTATVSSSATSDYLSTAYTTVRESADIGIGMTLAENHGGTLHYVIQVANAGPDNAHAVLLSDTLPQGLNFISATTTSGDCDHHPKVGSSGLLLCRIGNTPHQGTAQVDLIVQTTPAGSPVTNMATVLAKSVDSNQANNSATVTALVAP